MCYVSRLIFSLSRPSHSGTLAKFTKRNPPQYPDFRWFLLPLMSMLFGFYLPTIVVIRLFFFLVFIQHFRRITFGDKLQIIKATFRLLTALQSMESTIQFREAQKKEKHHVDERMSTKKCDRFNK